MSLQFILGSGTSDFESELSIQSIEWLEQDENNEVFYLVPNHIKFETEISVLKKIKKLQNNENPNFSSMRLQVFSFTRLAWYYLQNSENYSPEILNESSIAMILKKILTDCETDLTVYRGEIHHPGFIDSLGKLFNEFFQGNINSLDLENIVNNLGNTSQEIDLKHKLADLELLYANYSDYLSLHELQPVQLLSQLVDYLQTINMKNVMFIISGFSRFTVDESMLIECLIKHAGELRLSLVLDKSYYDGLPESSNLFFNSGKTYFNFYQLARNNSIQILADKKIKQDSAVSSKGIIQLDDYWKNLYSFKNADFHQADSNKNIKIWQSASSSAEIVGIAKEIHHLVATSDIRYKDIRILSRDIPYYRMIISPIFSKNNLPVSFEDEIKMTHHPLVVLIQSLFLVKKNYFKYKDIFRFLRTRLFMPTISGEETLDEYEKKEEIYQDKIDITENIVLAYGYEGKRWEQLDDWIYVPHNLNETLSNDSLLRRQKISNEIRNDIKCSLIPLFQSLDSCKKGRDAASCLYKFLIDNKIDKILLYWRNSDIEKGLLDEARMHEQAWQELIRLLDDYVTIFGEDSFKLDEFSSIFSTGLEHTTYSKVPSTIDQIAVSSLDTIHGEKKKITFIIGLTETILPMKSVNSTLLTDDERTTLDSLLPDENYIQQTAQQTMIQEPFIAYMAFMSCSEKLYLSYPIITDLNNGIKPSPYVENIKKMFNIQLEMKYNHPNMDCNSIKEISTNRQLVSDIIIIMRESKDEHSELSPFWEYLLFLAEESSEVNTSFSHVIKSLSVRNIPQTLSSNMIDILYGNTLYTSVSQIENFYNCEYKYLLRYGLKLYEREKFELNSMITGNFFHETLDRIVKYIISNNLNLISISEMELFNCVNAIINEVCGEPQFDILSRSSRMSFIRHLLTNTVQRVCWAFKQQSERSKIHTLQTELIFGNELQTDGLDGLYFKINNGKSIKVRGKIDRLDTIQIDGIPYFSIVDYKSSNHKFDYQDVYYGLAMQMITYLDVALNNAYSIIGKDAEPSGAFYLHITDPVIKPNEIGENIDLTLLNSYRYNGILLNNEELLKEMDTTIDEKQSSILFPFRRLANGSASSSQFVTKDDINNLRKHTHKKYEEAGAKIFSGSNQLNPAYQDKTRVACQNCEYRSICQFDVLLKENNYARIDKIKKDDALKKINDENIGGTSNE